MGTIVVSREREMDSKEVLKRYLLSLVEEIDNNRLIRFSSYTEPNLEVFELGSRDEYVKSTSYEIRFEVTGMLKCV